MSQELRDQVSQHLDDHEECIIEFVVISIFFVITILCLIGYIAK